MNTEKEKESKQNKKELTISEIVENKTNSYTLIQVRTSALIISIT